MPDDHAYCPHCRQLLRQDAPHPFPQRAVRCSGCRLLVGPGRSRAADGGPRRPQASGRASVAAAGDPVLDVLTDLRPAPPAVGLEHGTLPPHQL
ncbi:hypothetical protein ACVU7I_07770 [Patulibacter sp. S7RM1-6]